VSREWPSRRVLGTLLLVVLGVLLVVMPAPQAHAAASLDAHTRVLTASTNATGNVTRLDVRVTNHEPTPIRPEFAVLGTQWSVPNWWTTPGPRTLAPGETRTFTLYSPGSHANLRNGSRAMVVVENTGTEARATSSTFIVEKTPPNGTAVIQRA